MSIKKVVVFRLKVAALLQLPCQYLVATPIKMRLCDSWARVNSYMHMTAMMAGGEVHRPSGVQQDIWN